MVADVTPTDPGSIQAATTQAGWLRIPQDVPESERQGWVDDAAGALRTVWAEHWDDRADLVVPTMLRAALDERPDDHMVFEVWPLYRPARARVRISMIDPNSLIDWQAEGFSIIGYDGAQVGPGITCVRLYESTEAGASVSLIDWCSIFSDGERALCVLVETVPLDFFVLLQPGLHGLIETLSVTNADGSEFHSLPSEHAIVDDDAIWAALRLRDEGLIGTDQSPDAAREHGEDADGRSSNE